MKALEFHEALLELKLSTNSEPKTVPEESRYATTTLCSNIYEARSWRVSCVCIKLVYTRLINCNCGSRDRSKENNRLKRRRKPRKAVPESEKFVIHGC